MDKICKTARQESNIVICKKCKCIQTTPCKGCRDLISLNMTTINKDMKYDFLRISKEHDLFGTDGVGQLIRRVNSGEIILNREKMVATNLKED